MEDEKLTCVFSGRYMKGKDGKITLVPDFIGVPKDGELKIVGIAKKGGV
jgi:hypothetical protein